MRIKSCQGFPLHGSPRESQGRRFPLSQHLSLVTSGLSLLVRKASVIS